MQQHSETHAYQLGFQNLDQELGATKLPVQGELPAWLTGTLFRNGPARFSMGDEAPSHWFDGLAMVHRFTISGGAVEYANRFVRSEAYERAMETGKMGVGFGGSASGGQNIGLNPNVNVTHIQNRLVTLTESVPVIEIDPDTLDTKGVLPYQDQLRGQMTTAHPHFDRNTGDLYNFVTEFGPRCFYHVYRIEPGTATRQRIGSIETREPAYMHSFAITERFVILMEFPFVVNPLELLQSGKSYVDNLKWKPQQGTRFHVMNKSDGTIFRTYESEACFAFHHINAFEAQGEILIDIAASTLPRVGQLYVDELTQKHDDKPPKSLFRRYRLPFAGQKVTVELLSSEVIELPTISYRACNGKSYQFAYGISNSRREGGDFDDQLVKVDTKLGITKIWSEAGMFPGEPIFVPAPNANAKSEDDGVVMTVALDSKIGRSSLVVLDGKSFEEIARVEVPHHIPYGFHGLFVEKEDAK